MTPRQVRASSSSAAQRHLDRMLRGSHPPGHYHWHHVLGVLDVVAGRHTAAHVALLRRVARYQGTLQIDHRYGISHAMPPEEVLRCIAVRALGRWDRRKHGALIREVAERAEYPIVAQVAQEALKA